MKTTTPKTDLDLPEAYRTQANLWKAKYLEAYKELVKANKGIRRLKRKGSQAAAPHTGRYCADCNTAHDDWCCPKCGGCL